METVIKCEKIKEWNGKPIYSIGTSDGQGGESFAREIPIGTPVSELVFEPNGNYPTKVKWNKPQSGGGGGFQKQRSGNESFALSYSKDLVVAGKVDIKNIFTVADKMYDWLNSKKETVKEQPKQEVKSPTKDSNDNLPF